MHNVDSTRAVNSETENVSEPYVLFKGPCSKRYPSPQDNDLLILSNFPILPVQRQIFVTNKNNAEIRVAASGFLILLHELRIRKQCYENLMVD